MDQLVTARTEHLKVGRLVVAALRSWAAMTDFEEASPLASWCFTTMTGADQGGLACFGWDSRAIGTAGFLNAGVAL